MWANPEVEDAPDLLRVGQEITILPVDGVYHEVVSGETLRSIAGKYNVGHEAIIQCEYNRLEPPDYRIGEGMHLIVPGGVKPYVPKVVTAYGGPVPEGATGSGLFQWPVLGYISQGYWYGHRAIDLGAPTGSALLAADGGFVSFAGWTDVGYGYLVVINHQNGFATYYAHMSNVAAIPDRLENGVGKAKHQDVLHRILSQIMIDPEDLVFFKALVKGFLQVHCSWQIPTEGFLHHDSRPAVAILTFFGKVGLPQHFGNYRIQGRRNR